MRILLLTFYYPPDLSAGSFRAAALVEALMARFGPDTQIDVITTTPNRYAQLASQQCRGETARSVRIKRIPVPVHQSGVKDQARSFAHYFKGALAHARTLDADIVIATSSRLFTANLGAIIAAGKRKPLYLDLRDIFSETIGDVFKGPFVRAALPAIGALERWTLRRADRINIVSPAFADYLAKPAGHRNFATFTNGIDPLFLTPVPMPKLALKADRTRTVLVAGNIGEGQGLHHVIPGLAAALPDVHFRIIGAGGRRQALVDGLEAVGLDNAEVLDPIPRENLPSEYAAADVLMLHLNDIAAFDRVLPSKLFEYAATNLPILAGVAGFARTFVEDNVVGARTFRPCDVDEAITALRDLLAGPERFDRGAFTARFERRQIMAAMAEDIARTIPSVGNPIPAPSAQEGANQNTEI